MKAKFLLSFGVCLVLGSLALQAAVPITYLTPYSSFGGGDGWLAPGEGGYTFLGTANLERGLAYGNGHLYLVSRTGGSFVRILDRTTGADLGGLNMAGVSGGTYAVNTVGVGDDGAIYVNNLTTQSTTSPLKIYKWATEGSAAVVAYTGNSGLAGSRVGDSLAAIGGGSSTRLALGYGSTPAVAGNNGYSIVDPTAGTATAVGFVGTPPNAGEFRLGITFVDASRVIGAQGSSVYAHTSFSGASGTLLGRPTIPDPAGATADRLMAYTTLSGSALLAFQSIGDSHVSIYDVTDPNTPVWLASRNNTSGTLTANGNGTGQLAWGDAFYDAASGRWSKYLYTMSSNQGIQAFVVAIPEPGSFGLLGMGALMALVLRRRLS